MTPPSLFTGRTARTGPAPSGALTAHPTDTADRKDVPHP